MKKLAFFGFLTSLLIMAGSALAEDNPATLTTKGYVDKGLRTVYQKIDAEKANKDDVYTKEQVYTKTEIDNAGFLTTAAIEGKADADSVYTKEEIDNAGFLTTAAIEGKADADSVYTKEQIDNAGFITSEDVESGKKYVYTSNGWDAITVEDTFDPDFDFGG